MSDVYIVEACRSAIGKRGKGLAGMKPADLLGVIQKAALDRSGIAPESIDQVVGGCVSQVGEQTFNILKGDKTILQPNVTFHMIAVMQFGDWGVESSEAVRVTETGSELFCNLSRELHIK